MFVACSTLCFSREPLETALRRIADLEFRKIELAIHEDVGHLKPSEVAENPEAALNRLKYGPGLIPSSISFDPGAEVDPAGPVARKRFEAVCRLAKPLTVAVLTLSASPLGTPFDDEVRRLAGLAAIALREGLVPCVATDSETVTADPAAAMRLCQAVPGLALTLDPSHYLQGPFAGASFDALYPYVQEVRLRDTSRKPGEFQVRVGQGSIEYGKLVNLLERQSYKRALTVSIHDEPDNPFETLVEVRKLKLLLESLL